MEDLVTAIKALDAIFLTCGQCYDKDGRYSHYVYDENDLEISGVCEFGHYMNCDPYRPNYLQTKLVLKND